MVRQKYKTDEERKESKREYMKQYYRDNKEKIAKYNKQWRESNSEYNKKYRQKNKEKIIEQKKQYYRDNAEKIAEYNKQYYQANKEKIAEYQKQYHKQHNNTPIGRALNLINAHKQEDKKYNRGECTLTAKWIVDHIFSSKCVYCGESDWTKLGCDRIDNSLPHTPSNVVCSCEACNKKRGTKPFEEFLTECKTS